MMFSVFYDNDNSHGDRHLNSHGDRHLGMGACFHGIFFAIFLMVS